jgi:hypothetical protein
MISGPARQPDVQLYSRSLLRRNHIDLQQHRSLGMQPSRSALVMLRPLHHGVGLNCADQHAERPKALPQSANSAHSGLTHGHDSIA